MGNRREELLFIFLIAHLLSNIVNLQGMRDQLVTLVIQSVAHELIMTIGGRIIKQHGWRFCMKWMMGGNAIHRVPTGRSDGGFHVLSIAETSRFILEWSISL